MKRNSQRNHPALKFIGRAWAVTRPTSWTLGPLVVLLFLHQAACATKALHAIQPTAAPQHVDPGDLPQEEVRPRSDGSSHRPEPEDTENRWPYRLLAVPEMAWGGLTYPFKKAAIAYEQHDLMNRALDLFLNDERTAGVFPKFALGGTLSSGIGFTAFNNNLFRENKEARLSYILATRENQVAELSYRDPSLFGSQWLLDSNTFWLNFDESHFFLGGNRATERDQTNFELKQLAWDVTLGRKLFGNTSAALTGRLLIADAKPSERLPATPASITGNNSSMTALAIEPSLTYDSRDNPFRPTRGWFAEGAFTYTDQVDRDQFRYLGYRLEVQRYIPVFQGNRVLLLRAYLAKQDTVGGGAIPFYELNLLDLNNGLRGFDRGRWQDKGALLFNIEWRFPIWQDVEGDIFFDEGQVFGDYQDIQLKLFRYSAGAGLRFVSNRKFGLRFQVAASEDGVLTLLRGNLEFLRKRSAILGFGF
ncbi:MAG: BamA/TamA family outer membrane protein [Nitrospira sp.]|nr:BamA/TamA family outer membrane protein [Nitrospira sp.]